MTAPDPRLLTAVLQVRKLTYDLAAVAEQMRQMLDTGVPECATRRPNDPILSCCTEPPGHLGDHHDDFVGTSWPQDQGSAGPPVKPADPSPHCPTCMSGDPHAYGTVFPPDRSVAMACGDPWHRIVRSCPGHQNSVDPEDPDYCDDCCIGPSFVAAFARWRAQPQPEVAPPAEVEFHGADNADWLSRMTAYGIDTADRSFGLSADDDLRRTRTFGTSTGMETP